MGGGEIVARVLVEHGIGHLFTLCGGHISPILVSARERGIRVIDTRHEATAVFAADALARQSGPLGVAAVTAGPGVTNTVTAVKNAQLAQSPVVLLGGATATILRGKGSLQDIDQLALMKPHVKWARSVRRLRDLEPTLDRAIHRAAPGVPGPVFVEIPLDLLYDESTVREWYLKGVNGSRPTLAGKGMKLYLERHLDRMFDGVEAPHPPTPWSLEDMDPGRHTRGRARRKLAGAHRPVMLLGSQLMLRAADADRVADAVEHLGIPVYLSGMARGLLGRDHPLWMRHHRKAALQEADLVLLAGVPQDFRLDYGRHIGRGATIVSVNRSWRQLLQNRLPTVPVHADPAALLLALARETPPGGHGEWVTHLRRRDADREKEIARQAEMPVPGVNPVQVARELEQVLPDDSVVVVDGGDFVATASYVVSPRGPLRWLDPGVFGTLGVGAGFALGAAAARPDAQIWLLYGDGSAGYSVAEFDTFVRHGIPVIALVGNDASWAQIARDQVEILGDDVGTVLRRSDYDVVARGFGAKGLQIREPEAIPRALRAAQAAAAGGQPVLINAHIGATDFRKGSISM